MRHLSWSLASLSQVIDDKLDRIMSVKRRISGIFTAPAYLSANYVQN